MWKGKTYLWMLPSVERDDDDDDDDDHDDDGKCSRYMLYELNRRHFHREKLIHWKMNVYMENGLNVGVVVVAAAVPSNVHAWHALRASKW